MADTTGRIPLWLIGVVAGIHVIGLVDFFYSVTYKLESYPVNIKKIFDSYK